MNPVINFVEFENRAISAIYRNLMIGAKVVLVDKTSGAQLPDPVTVINSPVPNGSLRIKLPDADAARYYMHYLAAFGINSWIA